MEKVMEPLYSEECDQEEMGVNINVHGRVIKELRYADDVDILGLSEQSLQRQLNISRRAVRNTGCTLTWTKPKSWYLSDTQKVRPR